MKIALGCDHAGLSLKNAVCEHLKEKGIETVDFGAFSTDSCHYPVYAEKTALSVVNKECDLGILVCGTGIGMSIAANKIKGIRAALVSDCFSAEATRRHNDANILCLGQRVTGEGLALKLVDIFISTPFDGGRHAQRLEMIKKLEDK